MTVLEHHPERMCLGYCDPDPLPATELRRIFTPWSVRQILALKKTQTRRHAFGAERVAHPDLQGCDLRHVVAPDDITHWLMDRKDLCRGFRVGKCKLGRVGQGLRVIERWAVAREFDSTPIPKLPPEAWSTLTFAADSEWPPHGKWRSPLYLPNVHVRLRLKITRVRLERLQQITDADAIAEGMDVQPELPIVGQARFAFLEAYDRIHPPRRRSGADPWVWVHDFAIVEARATLGACPPSST